MKILKLVSDNKDLPVFKIHNIIIKNRITDTADKSKVYRHVGKLKSVNPAILKEFLKEEAEYEC